MRMSTRFSEFGVYSRSTTPSNFRKAAITFKASSSNDGPRGRAGTAKTDIIFYYYIMLHGSPLDCAEGYWFRIDLLAVLSPRTVCNYFHTCQIPKKMWTLRVREVINLGPEQESWRELCMGLNLCTLSFWDVCGMLTFWIFLGLWCSLAPINLVKPSGRH